MRLFLSIRWLFCATFSETERERDYFEGKQDSLLLIYCGLNPGLFHVTFNATCANLLSYTGDTGERLRNFVLIRSTENG